MKKICCIVVCILFSAAVFAQERKYVNTSEGRYLCSVENFPDWAGNGAGAYRFVVNNGNSPLDKLSNGQQQCVREMLNLYKTKKGEVYQILIANSAKKIAICVICEFTSDTEYRQWLAKMDL